MTHFNSFFSDLTTVYCVPDPRAIVWRCLYLSEESLVWRKKRRSLSLSTHGKSRLSAAQGDAEAPWWIQACWGYKSVSSGVCPYIQSTHTSTHPHTLTHPRWKIFPWVSSVSLCSTNSLMICRRGVEGRKKEKKKNKWATVQLGPAGVCNVSAWHQSWPKNTVFTVLSKYDPRYALCRHYEERCSAFNTIKSNKHRCIGEPCDAVEFMYIFILHSFECGCYWSGKEVGKWILSVVKSAANKHAMWEKLEWYILKNKKSW